MNFIKTPISWLIAAMSLFMILGCTDPVVREVKVEVIIPNQLVKSPDDDLPQPLKELLQPIEKEGDTVVVIPKITLRRVDISASPEPLEIPTSIIGQGQKSVGTYAFSDLKGDYYDNVPEQKSGKLLSTENGRKISLQEILDKYPQAKVLIEDSTRFNNNADFSSVTKFQKYLWANPKITSVTLVLGVREMPASNAAIENLIKRCYQELNDGKYARAQMFAYKLIDTIGISAPRVVKFREELTSKADKSAQDLRNTYENLQTPSGADCDTFVQTIGYYVCARTLSDTELQGEIDRKLNDFLVFINSKGCNIIVGSVPKTPSKITPKTLSKN
jgi:hypothetical protein